MNYGGHQTIILIFSIIFYIFLTVWLLIFLRNNLQNSINRYITKTVLYVIACPIFNYFRTAGLSSQKYTKEIKECFMQS